MGSAVFVTIVAALIGALGLALAGLTIRLIHADRGRQEPTVEAAAVPISRVGSLRERSLIALLVILLVTVLFTVWTQVHGNPVGVSPPATPSPTSGTAAPGPVTTVTARSRAEDSGGSRDGGAAMVAAVAAIVAALGTLASGGAAVAAVFLRKKG